MDPYIIIWPVYPWTAKIQKSSHHLEHRAFQPHPQATPGPVCALNGNGLGTIEARAFLTCKILLHRSDTHHHSVWKVEKRALLKIVFSVKFWRPLDLFTEHSNIIRNLATTDIDCIIIHNTMLLYWAVLILVIFHVHITIYNYERVSFRNSLTVYWSDQRKIDKEYLQWGRWREAKNLLPNRVN